MIEVREIRGGIELFEIGMDNRVFIEVSEVVKYVYLNIHTLTSFIEMVYQG